MLFVKKERHKIKIQRKESEEKKIGMKSNQNLRVILEYRKI